MCIHIYLCIYECNYVLMHVLSSIQIHLLKIGKLHVALQKRPSKTNKELARINVQDIVSKVDFKKTHC